MVTTGAAVAARGSARRRRCDLERDGERWLGRRLLFKRAGGLGGKAIGGGVSGAESWQRWTRTRRRSPTWVRFKVEDNADMRGPPVSETKRREDGALLGRGEKDDTDLWLLGRPKGRKGINKNFLFYFLNHMFKPNFNLNSNCFKI